MNWIENLKPGDRVFVNNGRSYSKRTVAAVSKREVRLDDGWRYTKSWGYRVGTSNSWHGPRLVECTPETEAWIEAEIKTDRANATLRRLMTTNVFNWPLDRKERLIAAMESVINEEGQG